jgi:hypothetical protein
MIHQKLVEATNKFNNKFTYNINGALKVTDKILIVCPIHGEFIQEVRVHLRSTCGCPKCSRIEANKKTAKSQEQFIHEANIIHNHKYSYEKTVYVNDSTKIIITCPEHGDFEQQAGSHIGKSACGCRKCAAIETSMRQKLSIEKLQVRLESLPSHITIDTSSYINSKTRIKGVCDYHGAFTQLPDIIYDGKGICPNCAKQLRGWNRSLYADSPTTIYILELENNLFKIGITKSCNVFTRYQKKDSKLIKQIVYQTTMLKGTDAWDLEKQILKRLSQYKYSGNPIFSNTGIAEILTINPEQLLKELIYEQLFHV